MNNYKVVYLHVAFVTKSTKNKIILRFKEFLYEQNSCFSSFKFQGQPTKTFTQNIYNIAFSVNRLFVVFQRHIDIIFLCKLIRFDLYGSFSSKFKLQKVLENNLIP